MALAPGDQLAAIKATGLPHFRHLDRLGVKDGGGGRVPSLDPDLLTEAVANAFPDPAEVQAAAVDLHSVPVRETVRQGAPLIARLIQIEKHVEEFTPVKGALAPRMTRVRQWRNGASTSHSASVRSNGYACLFVPLPLPQMRVYRQK